MADEMERQFELFKAQLAIELERHKSELARANAENLAAQERQWQSALEHSKAIAQHNLETWKTNTRHNLEVWKIQNQTGHIGLQAVVNFALAALKGIILVNGGAAITLLAFLGHIWSADGNAAKKAAQGLVEPLIYFSGGAGAGILAAAVAYIAQVLFSELAMRPNGTAHRWPGEVVRVVGVIIALLGIAAFFCGTLESTKAFQEGAKFLASTPAIKQ